MTNTINVPRETLQAAVDALDRIAKLGNGESYGNSTGNTMAYAAMQPLRALLDAPSVDDKTLRHRIRVHLANRYEYSHREFCSKLEDLMEETL